MKRIPLIIMLIASIAAVSGINLYSGEQRLDINIPIIDMKGRLGKVDVKVLDTDDEAIGWAYKYIYVTSDHYSVSFRVDLKEEPRDRDLLRVKVGFKNEERVYSLYQLEDRMVISVLGQDEFIEGTPINYRIIVRNQRDNAPVENARVEISLKAKDMDKVIFKGMTDRSGTCTTDFTIPAEIDEADLHFAVSSDLGKDAYDTRIKLLSGNLTYVVTDKPVYQPGQTIHIRSLSLRRPDLKAVNGESVLYEVEDSKGNKVFKKQVDLDELGVGYTDFLLADEVNHGDYTIRAILQGEEVEKTVNVKRYVLPKFSISLTTEKEFYLPGGKMEGDLDVQYFFGKPVVDGAVKITVYKYDIGFQEEAVIEGRTDKEGRYHFSYDLPDHFVGQPLEKGDAFVRLDVEVIDPANHSEKISVKKKIVQDLIGLTIVPEGGVLKPGLENRIYVLATYPDGTPCLAQVEMTIDGRRFRGRTDSYGVAEFAYKPRNIETSIRV
ncbi:MAG: MG2 domain-containing protein, partial [candidate division WOR-3 bacterium]